MLNDFQKKVARIVLAAAEPFGFALGGGAALIVYGIVDRPTKDIDSYTNNINDNGEIFDAAVKEVVKELENNGLEVKIAKSDTWFAALEVTDNIEVDTIVVDLGYDYRTNQPIFIAELGKVLHIDDIVTGKIRALWTRAEGRDYMDINALLSTERYSVQNLFDLIHPIFPEITKKGFSDHLRAANLRREDYLSYGLNENNITALSKRFEKYADELYDKDTDDIYL